MNNLYNNKKENTLTFVFVSALIILSVLIAVFYNKINTNLDSENKIMQSYNMHLAIIEVVSDINEAEIKQRDFINLQDSLKMSDYNFSVTKLQNSYNTLAAFHKTESSQQKNLRTLKNYIDIKFPPFQWDLMSKKQINRFGIKAEQHKKVFHSLLLHINMMKGKQLFSLSATQSAYAQDRNFPPMFFLAAAFLTVLIISSAYWKIQSGFKHLKKSNNELIVNKIIYEYSEEIGLSSHFFKYIYSEQTYFSKNSYKILGITADEFSNFTKFIEFVHPDDRKLVTDIRQKIINGENTFTYYFRVIRKDGQLRYIKSAEKVISDLFQERILIGIYLDITDELQKAKELEEKVFDLEISNKELSAFNYVASHDLQEPLRKVQLFISKIRTEHFDSFPISLQQSFNRIEAASYRMEKLIFDLLLFSRSNKLNKEFEEIDLNLILKNTIQDFDESLKEKKTNLAAGILPTINGIAFQIQQLFNNIISNSLKYAKENIPLQISIAAKIVAGDEIPKLRYKTLKYYQISFADNGIGFDQQYAESIFTIFSRLHDNSQYTGTGIGLAICKKIVDNHKGTISAEGITNGGAVFHVFFPV
ncbi:ATP-binding protein [Flavobacterium aestuarii]|uniref:ATP-binding protein n=1 Tax=Flavobacterium aestuarii TaxID=3149227 RepID=UPI0032B5CD09